MQGKMKAVLPQFIELGKKKVDNLLSLFSAHHVSFRKVLVLYDETTLLIGGQDIVATLSNSKIRVRGESVQNSDEINVGRIKAVVEKYVPDLVIGFGGGKVLDVAKLAAAEHHTRFISIPTTLSNDGLASPVSVIKNAQQIPISHITKPPYGVVIDIDVVKKAPPRHLMAGVGDLISNLSAVYDARLARDTKAQTVDRNALALAEAGGLKLLALKTRDIGSSIFLRSLAQGLIKSGFAMCISGTSQPASGSEHKISHSIDHYFPRSKALHGEQVGIATIFTMALQKNKFHHRVRQFYGNIGFPTELSYLNLAADEFVTVVLNAAKSRPERYTILEAALLTATDIRRIIKETKL
jgi:glycerol-1-phosphate dehydrogenase [NAD(P)+]